jgi:hypothetical protein
MSDKDVELADLSIPKETFLTWLTNKREILLPDINDADDNLRGTIMEVLGLLQLEPSSYYTSDNNPNSQYYWPNIKTEIVNKFRLLYIYLIGELDKETTTKTQSELIAWKSGTKKYIEEALNIAIKTQKGEKPEIVSGGKKRKKTRRKQTRRKQTRRKQTRRKQTRRSK